MMKARFWLFPLVFSLASAALAVEKFDVPQTMFISHRGESHDAPENTMPAYDMAHARGFGFEMDIYLSKDGKIFCLHDSNLRRLAGKNLACEDANWETDVRDLDVGKWKGKQWEGVKPCLFEDVLKKHVGEVPLMLVHVKTDKRIVPYLVEIMKRNPKANPSNLAWTGNNTEVARLLEEALPGYRFFLGVGTPRKPDPDDPDAPIRAALKRMRSSVAKVAAVHWNRSIVTATYVKALHDAGYQVDVWTPDTPEDVVAALKAGVDYITTNRAKLVYEAVHK